MPELAAHLRHFDDAWDHEWESLRSALEGVGEEEAFWQSPAYRGETPEPGWPPPGSVAWHVAHVAHCKRYYADVIRAAGTSDRPPVRPWEPCDTFPDLRAGLEQAHVAQRVAIEAIGDDRLTTVAGNGQTLQGFLAMCVRHDTWHAAQIQVARRLFRMRSA